jgi:hypothetical protein
VAAAVFGGQPLEEWTRSESASTRSAAAEPLAESTRQVLTCEASDSDVLPRCTQILRHGTS